jgi:aspartyl protease family protein
VLQRLRVLVMRLSSGVRLALSEAAKWLLVSAIAITTVVWFDELKAGVSDALGLQPTHQPARQASIETTSEPTSGTAEVELRAGAHGHFTATATINGRSIPVLVDTGASMVALSHEDAERAGVFVRPSDFTGRVSTANGIARIAPVLLDSVSIGDITLYDVEAAVSEPGRLGTTLLGMTFIGRLSRAEMRGGVLILQE